MECRILVQSAVEMKLLIECDKAITSVGRLKMKRDTGVKAVFLLRKKTAFTPASLFIFGQLTDVTLLEQAHR